MNIPGNRKNFGILIIILGLVLIGVIVYFVFFHDFDPQQKVVPVNISDNGQAVQLTDSNNVQDFTQNNTVTDNLPLLTDRELSQEGVKQIAASFAERYGTWSNQSNSSNLVDLKLMMTKSMQVWADDNIIATQTNDDYQEYYGMTTKAIIVEAKSFTENKAVILVGTQRTENKAGQIKTFNQNLQLDMVKSGQTWLVDGAYWQ